MNRQAGKNEDLAETMPAWPLKPGGRSSFGVWSGSYFAQTLTNMFPQRPKGSEFSA